MQDGCMFPLEYLFISYADLVIISRVLGQEKLLQIIITKFQINSKEGFHSPW